MGGDGLGPPRQHLGVLAVLVEKLRRLVDRGGACVFECGRDHLRASFPSWDMPRALSISFHSRSGLAGMSTCLIPKGARASQMALMTAALAAIVPASPIPLTPSSLLGLGVTLRSSTISGISFAVRTM